MHSVEDALLLGADAVVLMAFVGIPVELETYRIVARVAGECLRANLPLVVEALPCPGERIPDPRATDAMASAARIGFEHGADLVKSYFTENFQKVTDNCPVPVLIAGGPKMDTVEETLQVVHDATRAGAAGVVFGRNIWQSGDTRGMIQALRRIIHEGQPATASRIRGSEIHPVGAVREPPNDEPPVRYASVLGRETRVPRTTLQRPQTCCERLAAAGDDGV